MCLASVALGRLWVVRVCFNQIWPRWWRKIVVVADDLAMACQAPEGRAEVGPYRETPPLALDPG